MLEALCRRAAAIGTRVLTVLLLVPFASLAPVPAQEEGEPLRPTERPFLWRIEGEATSWLYGTIHVPDARVAELPGVVEQALEDSDVFLTEIRMDRMGGMQARMMLPKGESLDDILPGDLWERLEGYLGRREVPAAMVQRMKPWAAMMTVVSLEMREAILAGEEPLDLMLWKDAQYAGKELDALETLDEQLEVFESFSTDEQVTMLEATLDVLEELEAEERSLVQELVGLYLEGDADKLMEELEKYSGVPHDEELEERFEEQLIHARNRRMAERIAGRLREHPERSFFFAIGTAHYPGEEGILELLREEGFEIERVVPAEQRAQEPVKKAG